MFPADLRQVIWDSSLRKPQSRGSPQGALCSVKPGAPQGGTAERPRKLWPAGSSCLGPARLTGSLRISHWAERRGTHPWEAHGSVGPRDTWALLPYPTAWGPGCAPRDPAFSRGSIYSVEAPGVAPTPSRLACHLLRGPGSTRLSTGLLPGLPGASHLWSLLSASPPL